MDNDDGLRSPRELEDLERSQTPEDRERLEREWRERHPNPSGLDDGDPDKAPKRIKSADEIEGAAAAPKDRLGVTGYAKAVWVGSPNYTLNRAGHNPNWSAAAPQSWITFHTMVGWESAARARFENPAQQASSTYGVTLAGKVYQYVDEKDGPWTNGTMVGIGSNLDSITIEHEDGGNYNGPRTPALYEAAAQLVADIHRRHGIPLVHRRSMSGGCLGHRECDNASTACPDALDIDRIVARANQILNPPPPTPPAGWKVSQTIRPFMATFVVFAPGGVQKDRWAASPQTAALAVDQKVVVTGYSYASPAIRSADMGNGQPGDDYLWWQTAGGHVSDAILDTSGTPNLPENTTFDSLPPAPPPDNRPEWQKNLKAAPASYVLTQPVPVVDMTTGKTTLKSVPTGPLATAYTTVAGGVDYAVTQYSVDHTEGLGMRQADIDAAQKPTPDPGPPQPPPGALNWLQSLIDWMKKLFGGG